MTCLCWQQGFAFRLTVDQAKQHYRNYHPVLRKAALNVRYADAFHHNDVDRPFDRRSSQWPDVAERCAEQVQAAHHYQQQRADRAVRASQRSTKRTHFARRRSTDARRLAQRRQSRAYVFHCAIYDISRHFQRIPMVKLFKLKNIIY